MSEASVWHQERKTQDWTEYYIALVDGEQEVSCILKSNKATKEVQVEPYSPPDFNYTVHDSCDHENDECVLEDPDSWEYQAESIATDRHYALENLRKLEKQVRMQHIALAAAEDQ